ncbi:exodeoxyribonuclease VII small subunit [Erysipelothrix rhusiopathiae]|uniref:Exodeoxyribonuclease 7 small subunit n=1 Tax=Erysipelothrix rhusiopathiae ATCC 19414 TaxID=525280 RepID=E7FU91_ERYRH|nr:exodeoxyribonuclease VII small subunit [Erysipelothrix rhusiopathiae]AGN24087.1 exodeoxyribonuclease VII small subunit [Erysipelothrix rhusiopathiae SY1027]AMS11125.1 exodeoxyribonuclease VII small subunit [Erysipelothrix rhusiopathiae]AOO67623.1 exodeoxyribonuclease VII small subunit [Erysipelothrix rhusiopathiae]AWU41515.1 exodeoxyribonuclease VII small subunit [Erysipelothrix rhusiopathiae]EFY09632.1 exodeoxyribonuclease VII, small subunit [Erysipelothrix rhusiopathiae ATCC 19414]
MNKDFNFEIAMARLAEIANELEKDSLPLDQAIVLFEEGLNLSKQCQERLSGYENQVKALVQKHQGDQND